MDRKGGMAAVAVLIAVLGISFMPRKAGESAAPAEPAGHGKSVRPREAATPKLDLKPACAQIGDRVERFYEDEIRYPESCYSQGSKDAEQPISRPNLRFVIALVPDPAQTNLPLLFDRLIETIQQAAQDENYSYDSSWFPWTEEKSYDRFEDDEQAEELRDDLQKQPGLLTFRRSANRVDQRFQAGLLVFVVGEQPTGGINDEQFENALAWIDKLGGDPEKRGLRILGPTFSGSLASLARELSKTGAAANYLQNIFVYSGTANSNESIDRFKRFLCNSAPNQCTRFRSFLESDELMTHRFLQFLNQSHYELNKVVILSEDETAFGNQPPPPSPPPDAQAAGSAEPGTNGETKQASASGESGSSPTAKLEDEPIRLYYPRDIATLRSAYSRQSIFNAGKSQTSTTLRADLGEDASSKHDSVVTYAGDLTPLSQEAALFGIVNVLKAKRIQFIVIRSSNSLDQLFLAEFLRRSYPSGRVVLDGADLLFRRSMEGTALRGVMMLSTYPLLSWTQDLIRPVQVHDGIFTVVAEPPPKSYRIFGSDLAEGTYIAARGLFSGHEATGRSISDYGPPIRSGKDGNADDLRPATWLTVVGHGQFWPMAVLNSYTLGNGSEADSLSASTMTLLQPAMPPAVADVKAGDTANTPPAPAGQRKKAPADHTFPADSTALMIFCWALALAHWYLCWTGCMIGSPAARAYFAPIPSAEQPALIFIGSLLLGALAVTFAGTTGLMNGFYGGHQRIFLWIAVTFLGGCGLVGLLKNYSLPVLGTEQPANQKQPAVFQKAAAASASAGEGPTGPTSVSEQDTPSARQADEPGTGGDPGATTPDSTRAEKKAESLLALLRSKGLYVGDALATRKVPGWVLATLWLVLLACLLAIRVHLNRRITLATYSAAFWRNSHISNGVSGLLPQVLLILGMYAWFWYNLRGLSLFGEDRPLLPKEESLPERFEGPDGKPVLESQDDRRRRKANDPLAGKPVFSMFSAEEAGAGVERAARPLSWFYLGPFILILLATPLLCWLSLGEQVVLTLGDRAFGAFIFFVMCVAISIILSDTLRFAFTWGRLRQLLVFLDRLRLRRTLAHLKGLSWTSVLSMSGHVLEERYRLVSRQLESARNLQTALAAPHPGDAADKAHQEIVQRELAECEKAALSFAEDYAAALSKVSPERVAKLKRDLAAYQQLMAKTAGCVLTHLIVPAWQREGESLILEVDPADKTEDKGESRLPLATEAHVRAAEEFFVLPYLGFIQNALGAMRTVAIGILLLFTATTLALSSYPFSPAPELGAIFLVLFSIVGATVIFVYAGMHRDATLSHITQTRPGELGFDFYSKIFSFGIGPLIGLLTTLFPAITDFVVSWLQPGAETMK